MEENNDNIHYHSKGNFSPIDDLITNQPIDDDYINQLYHRLNEMKKQRKSVEKDTQLLNVRVNCLKNEEGKTVKQIELTKKKTKDKLLFIQQSKIEEQRRLRIQQEREREIKEQRDRIMRQRVTLTNSTIMKREAKMKKVFEEARLFKEELKSTNEFLKCLKNEEIINKKNNNEMIKSQQLINQEKKRAILLEKKAVIKLNLEGRIKEELILKAENDYKIQQLQEVEIKIMKRIQETTQMHKMLLQEFEEVIMGDSYMYNNQELYQRNNEEEEGGDNNDEEEYQEGNNNDEEEGEGVEQGEENEQHSQHIEDNNYNCKMSNDNKVNVPMKKSNYQR